MSAGNGFGDENQSALGTSANQQRPFPKTKDGLVSDVN
jgi:hypothetical protein